MAALAEKWLVHIKKQFTTHKYTKSTLLSEHYPIVTVIERDENGGVAEMLKKYVCKSKMSYLDSPDSTESDTVRISINYLSKWSKRQENFIYFFN